MTNVTKENLQQVEAALQCLKKTVAEAKFETPEFQREFIDWFLKSCEMMNAQFQGNLADGFIDEEDTDPQNDVMDAISDIRAFCDLHQVRETFFEMAIEYMDNRDIPLSDMEKVVLFNMNAMVVRL